MMAVRRKKQLIAAVAAELNIGPASAGLAVNTVLGKIVNLTASGDMLILPGFGTFMLRHRRASETRNPRTGEPMPVPASTRLGFKASKGETND
jgi:DNA-binding protein HU-beta